MKNDQARLLDIVCKRYGLRPSDLLGEDLDEYQAFQFDAGVAFRYTMIERDDHNRDLNTIMNGVNALLRAQGQKNAKHQDYKPVVAVDKPKNTGSIVDGGVTSMTVTEVIEA